MEAFTDVRASSKEGATMSLAADGAITVSGKNPDKDTYQIETELAAGVVHGVGLEVLADESLPGSGPGRAKNGNFVLNTFELFVGDADTPASLNDASAAFSQQGFSAGGAVDRDAKSGWALSPRLGRDHVATFEFAEPLELERDTRVFVRLTQQHGGQHTLGKFRVIYSRVPRQKRGVHVPRAVRSIALKETRTGDEEKRLRDHYRTVDPVLTDRAKRIAVQESAAPKAPGTKARILTEIDKPRTTRLLERGDFLRPGDEVKAHTPAILHTLLPRGEAADRIDLVNWLFDPANPLTARVAVNRIWQHLFGQGLVVTPEDFGTRGERPSHPELLDYLATEYQRQKWSLKSMIRTIVLSSTYRQSSNVRPELLAIDADNRLLARQNRYRFEAEVVRDVYLVASGLLERRVGGPSIRPPLPDGVRELGYANSVKWPESKGSDRHRRGMYIFFQRTVPYPMLTTFDAPDSMVACVRRRRSNTPLQALTLLNDPVFLESARALGEHAVEKASGDEARARAVFVRATGRFPTSEELAALTELADDLESHYRTETEAASALSGELAEGFDPATAATWIAVARVVLNLDETVTRG